MKRAVQARGAALVEYVILLGLVCVLCLGAVVGVGAGVKDVFDEVSGEIAGIDEKIDEVITDTEGEGGLSGDENDVADGGDEFAETIRWRQDGSLPLASYVTTSASGSYRYFTVDLAGMMAAKGIPRVAGMKYDASLVQAGTARKGKYSTWALRTDISVTWNVPDEPNPYLISVNGGAYSPETEFVASDEVLGRNLPDGADGIKVRRYLHCNPGSICTADDMVLDVRIYEP